MSLKAISFKHDLSHAELKTQREGQRGKERTEEHVKAMDWHFSPVNIFYCSLTNAHRNHKKPKSYTILLHSHSIFMYIHIYSSGRHTHSDNRRDVRGGNV